MNYKSYKLARDLAWEMLVWQNVRELPVDVVSISKNMGINAVYGETFNPGVEGYCTIVNGHPYIVINPELSRQRERFVAAHELGHILLGHVGDYQNVYSKVNDEYTDPHEQEANVFATRLLAPACVLISCKALTAEDIMKLCDISRQEAELRAKRLQELSDKNRIAVLPLERAVMEQFKDFISRQQEASF